MQRRPRDRGLLRCSFLLSLVGRGAARRTFSIERRDSARRLPDGTKWICRHLFPARCAKMSSSLQPCKSSCACVGRKSKHPCAKELRDSLPSSIPRSSAQWRSLRVQRRPRDRGLLRCSFLLSLVGRGAARRTFSIERRDSARRLPDETKWICRHLFPARCAKMSSSLQPCKSSCACVGRKSKHPCANEVRSSLFSMSSRRLRKAWRCRTSAAA